MSSSTQLEERSLEEIDEIIQTKMEYLDHFNKMNPGVLKNYLA